MWGLKPLRGTTSGIKPENSFSALSPLSPTVARYARHSHPSPPEKKAASRKKSRLRRKKTAPMACRTESCVVTPERWGTAVAKQLPKNDALLQFIRCLIVECGGL